MHIWLRYYDIFPEIRAKDVKIKFNTQNAIDKILIKVPIDTFFPSYFSIYPINIFLSTSKLLLTFDTYSIIFYQFYDVNFLACFMILISFTIWQINKSLILTLPFKG